MLVKNQMVKVKWSTSNKKWYESKGYKFTRFRDVFTVKAEDLSITSKIKVKVICDYCGNVYETSFSTCYNGINVFPKCACGNCAGKKAQEINNDKRALDRYNKVKTICDENGYTLLSNKDDFKNIKTGEVVYICGKHGIKKSSLDNFLRGHLCDECGYEKISNKLKKSLDDVEQEIKSVNGNILLNKEDYIDANTSNLMIKCSTCGHIFKTSLANYRRLICGCPMCGIKRLSDFKKMSCDEVELIINSVNNNKLLNKEEYIKNNVRNLNIECGECGDVYTTSLVGYQSGEIRCKGCSHRESRNENKIKKFLDINTINYVQQKTFSGCVDKRPLPFDFYLPDYNLVIEYDGEGHYTERFYDGRSSNTKEALMYTQRHDEIKTQYCKNNNINLLRIPYWKKDDIEKILTERLGLHSPSKKCA